MNTVAVNVWRRDEMMDLQTDLQRARALANLLDAQFELAGVKFGLDALVGIVPVVGDTITAIAGVYPIYLARKYKLGRTVQLRMLANLAIDYFGGLIPLAGDAFDVAFKANLKNLDLLEQAARNRAFT